VYAQGTMNCNVTLLGNVNITEVSCGKPMSVALNAAETVAYVGMIDENGFTCGGVRVINITNPANPTAYSVGYNGTSRGVYDMVLSTDEKTLFLADEDQLTILNVSDPTNITHISTTPVSTTTSCCTTKAIALNMDETVVFLQLSAVLQSFNVTDLKNPSFLNEYKGISLYCNDMVLSKNKNHLFQTLQSDGINVVSVANASNMINVSLQTSYDPSTNQGGRLDSTGNYLYVASRFDPRLSVLSVSGAPTLTKVGPVYQPSCNNCERYGVCTDKNNGSLIATVGATSILTLFDTRNVTKPVWAGESVEGSYYTDKASRCELRVGSGRAYTPNTNAKSFQIWGFTCPITADVTTTTTNTATTNTATTNTATTNTATTNTATTNTVTTTTSTGSSTSGNGTKTSSGSVITFAVLLLSLITLLI
jgi:hypothetical protein